MLNTFIFLVLFFNIVLNHLFCQDQQECLYKPQNFMTKIIQQTDQNEIIKHQNMNLIHYSNRKIEIKYFDQEIGKGLVNKEKKIQKNSEIFKFNPRKIISSFEIFKGNFFLNSLNVNHKNFLKKIRFSYNDNDFIIKKTEMKIITNLIYHFANFNQSHLKHDLQGLPLMNSPIFNVSQAELNLIQDEYLKTSFYDHKFQISQEYNLYIHNLERQLTPNEFNFIFQMNALNIDEFFYSVFVIRSRAHRINQLVIALIPYLHYINMNGFTKQQYDISHKNSFQLVQKNKNEIEYNEQLWSKTYHIDSEPQNIIYHYLLFYGFIPSKLLSCFEIDILTYQEAQFFNVPQTMCHEHLHNFDIQGYQVIKQIMQLDFIQQQQIMENLKEFFVNDLQQNLLIYTGIFQLFQEFDNSFWNSIVDKIRIQIQQYQQFSNLLSQQQQYTFTLNLISKFYHFKIKEFIDTIQDIQYIQQSKIYE